MGTAHIPASDGRRRRHRRPVRSLAALASLLAAVGCPLPTTSPAPHVLASSSAATCAVVDGDLRCFGPCRATGCPRLVVPDIDDDILQVEMSATNDSTCVLTVEHDAICWANSRPESTYVRQNASHITALLDRVVILTWDGPEQVFSASEAAGWSHANVRFAGEAHQVLLDAGQLCQLYADDSSSCVRADNYGDGRDNTDEDEALFERLTGVRSLIDGGHGHTCLLRDEGVQCRLWARPDDVVYDETVPDTVDAPQDAVMRVGSDGPAGGCAVNGEGHGVCWGSQQNRYAGFTDTTHTWQGLTETGGQVDSLCALDDDGSLWCWTTCDAEACLPLRLAVGTNDWVQP